MKRVFTFLLSALFLSLSVCAQSPDWSTIGENDTVYFEGSHFYAVDNMLGISQNDSFRLLRMIRVDSSSQTSSGKMLFFPTTIRQQGNGNMPCLLPKAGWQGPYCFRNPNGEELFVNRRGDTIFIPTRATAGSTWWVVVDSTRTSGILATALGVGTTLVDGVVDSFRETSLQAYRNNAPVAHSYNGRKLRWSKNHGWLQTLDFYTFPYSPLSNIRSGALEDSTQYVRKPQNRPFYKGLSDSDVFRKYTPGNEWIFFDQFTASGFPTIGPHEYNADSVISRQQVGNQLIVTLRYHHYSYQTSPSGSTHTGNSGIRTDTIPLGQTLVPFPEILQPDVPDIALFQADSPNYQPWYTIDTLCEGKIRVRTRPFSSTDILYPDSVCTHLMGNISGSTFKGEDYLVGFGLTRRFAYDVPYGVKSIKNLMYLRMGNCNWGNYINVPALSVTMPIPEAEITLGPNPADQYLRISLPAKFTGSTFSITNTQGRGVMSGMLENPETLLPVQELPSGLYLIQVSGKEIRSTGKIAILH